MGECKRCRSQFWVKPTTERRSAHPWYPLHQNTPKWTENLWEFLDRWEQPACTIGPMQLDLRVAPWWPERIKAARYLGQDRCRAYGSVCPGQEGRPDLVDSLSGMATGVKWTV